MLEQKLRKSTVVDVDPAILDTHGGEDSSTDYVQDVQLVDPFDFVSKTEVGLPSSKCGNLVFIILKERKKVLLRERKRHTDRDVSSTQYVVLSGGGGEQGKVPCSGG